MAIIPFPRPEPPRRLPHAIESEQAVLGSALLNNALIERAPDLIEEGLLVVERERPTDVGPVDFFCRDAAGVAAGIDGLEIGHPGGVLGGCRRRGRVVRAGGRLGGAAVTVRGPAGLVAGQIADVGQRRRVEPDPAVVVEMHLDPGVCVVAGDQELLITDLGALGEADRHPGRDVDTAQHDRHRCREELAMPPLRIEEEVVDGLRFPSRRRAELVLEVVLEVLLDGSCLQVRRGL